MTRLVGTVGGIGTFPGSNGSTHRHKYPGGIRITFGAMK